MSGKRIIDIKIKVSPSISIVDPDRPLGVDYDIYQDKLDYGD